MGSGRRKACARLSPRHPVNDVGAELSGTAPDESGSTRAHHGPSPTGFAPIDIL